MSVPHAEDRPFANPVVVLREESDDWAILYNPDTADAVGLNPVGVAVWRLLDGDNSVAAIGAQLHDQFADTPPDVCGDLCRFVDALADLGFVGYEVPEGRQ